MSPRAPVNFLKSPLPIILFISILFFALSPLSPIHSKAFAATYYVDVTNGRDINNGLSPESAWKTIAKVNASRFNPGDQVLFKRGETWREQLTVPSSGSAGLPITFGAYGSGNKPIIDNTPDLPGWDTSGNWTSTGTNIWSLSFDYIVPRVFLNGTEYFQATSKDTIDSTHRWFYDSTGKVFYVYATSNPATFYSSMKLATATWSDSAVLISKDYVNLDGLETRGGYFSTYVSGSNHVDIANCTIGLNAMKGVGLGGTNSYIDVHGCTIESGMVNITEPWPPGLTGGYGDGVHFGDYISAGSSKHCKIYNNTISNWDHDQVGIIGTDTTDNEVYGNDMSCPNTNYGRAVGVGSSTDNAVRDNKIYNNYMHHLATSAIGLNGNNNSVYYNIINNVRTNIGTSTYNGGIYLSTSPTKICHDNLVYNNVIYNVANHGIWLYADGTHANQNNVIKNNIIMNWGTYGGETFYAIEAANSYVGAQTISNNVFNKAAVSKVIEWIYGGTTYTVSEFQASPPAGCTAANNVSSDPLFVNAGTDFHHQPTSPAINTGTNVGLTSDYAGVTVPQGSAPDIGAYEYQPRVVPPRPPQNLLIQ
jgi:hypothetical protein